MQLYRETLAKQAGSDNEWSVTYAGSVTERRVR